MSDKMKNNYKTRFDEFFAENDRQKYHAHAQYYKQMG